MENWISSLLWVLLWVFVYINVGYIFAHLNWNIAHSKKRRIVLRRILWPLSAGDKINSVCDIVAVHDFQTDNYKMLVSIFWPIKISWNILFETVIIMVIIFISFAILLLKLFTLPIRYFTNMNSIDELSISKTVSALF